MYKITPAQLQILQSRINNLQVAEQQVLKTQNQLLETITLLTGQEVDLSVQFRVNTENDELYLELLRIDGQTGEA